ncbi:type II and III secretion system protein family protein [Alkalimonas mucilaginosa]|uniref:Pilus assembly protein N-terminal domain-containing protein n=1 Tax=Alkalimonas mucilaginosa TaxID=3057676 RepID=A0ABU7JKY1_9GAMM|nr:pilus assembly protein N-terminal domain-containing protein [Alkalimonas sp. MEB004]MEE2025765.1 pilus assembly protein N-terminal domain-containing protein [Alkalimonas sp. MEB004]
MKSVQLSLLWVLLCLASFYGYAHYNQPFKMYVGSVELYAAPDVERIVIGNGSVLSAKVVDEKGVLLFGDSVGESDLQLWLKDGRLIKLSVYVTVNNSLRGVARVKHMLSAFPQLAIQELEGLIIVSGHAPLEAQSQIEAALDASESVVNMINYTHFGPGLTPMVRMDVKIVEFSKSNINNIGVRWESGMAGPAFGAAKSFSANQIFHVSSPGEYLDGINSAITNRIGVLDHRSWTSFGIVTGIGSQIQLLSEKGDARMLAQPNLMTRSGQTASFLAGGEFPISVVSALGSPVVEFKEYGIRLEIEPVVDSANNITSKIMAEVSSLDPSVSIAGVPGMLTRRTESVVNVHNGETIVISGLVNSQMSKAVSKFPLLGDIPILGELFKSRDFRDEKTELMIFVTPTIVFPEEASHQRSLERAREMVEQSQDMKLFSILD